MSLSGSARLVAVAAVLLPSLGWAKEQTMPSEINDQWFFQHPAGGGLISNSLKPGWPSEWADRSADRQQVSASGAFTTS